MNSNPPNPISSKAILLPKLTKPGVFFPTNKNYQNHTNVNTGKEKKEIFYFIYNHF